MPLLSLRQNQSLVAVLSLLLLYGCNRNTETPATSPPAPQVKAQPAPHVATMDEWKAALLSSYTESQVKDIGDGVTEFFSVFSLEGNKKIYAFGKRDGFRRLRFYTPGLMSNGSLGPYVRIYLSVPDGERPALLLTPYFFGKNGWLFMSKVAVMVDGEVVFERDFKDNRVRRNAENWGVEETYDLITTSADINGLRKIKKESSVSIRLTGEKGFVTLKKDFVGYFKDEIRDALFIYDKMNDALDGHIPPAKQQ